MSRSSLLFLSVALWAGLMVRHTDAQGEICIPADGGTGVCQAIRFCPKLRALLQQVKNNGNPSQSQGGSQVELLRKSLCKFLGPEPLVCCPEDKPTPAPSQIADGGNLLPSDCGLNTAFDRIIDGNNAVLGHHGWMVIFRGTNGNKESWFCGGSLINKRYVLSAAHCFRKSSRTIPQFARIGEHTFDVNPDCANSICAPGVQDIPIEDIINHPDYNKGCRHCNDISLVRLQRDVIFDQTFFVRAVCLPVDPEKDMGFPMSSWSSKQAVAAGWGSTSRNADLFIQPDVLQEVQLPLEELDYCRQLKRNYFEKESVLCAGGLGQDTCRADSGGPLTLGDQFDQRRYLIGVTSLGPVVCGQANSQGLYTNVHHYISWILSTLKP